MVTVEAVYFEAQNTVCLSCLENIGVTFQAQSCGVDWVVILEGKCVSQRHLSHEQCPCMCPSLEVPAISIKIVDRYDMIKYDGCFTIIFYYTMLNTCE